MSDNIANWSGHHTPKMLQDNSELMQRLLYEVKRVVVGQDLFLETTSR